MKYDVTAIVERTEHILKCRHDETLMETNAARLHDCLGEAVMLAISDQWARCRKKRAPLRHAYYFSAEYLVGRLIYSNLYNLGILQELREAFCSKGVDLALLEEVEDAALGNGGLGRLAACFLDSAATLDLPLTGYGLRYRFGLFKQRFEQDSQKEMIDDWTRYGDPWSYRRDKYAVRVAFADQTVIAVPYEMPIIGYHNDNIGTLRLWQCEAVHELDFEAFNAQDYYQALAEKNAAENITRVLYPNDSTWEGKRLRIKQQYVLSSASLQDILRHYNRAHGDNWKNLAAFCAIQLNDTHPAMSIPELIRLLMERGLDFDRAFAITRQVFSYTNHTVMSEALEKWNEDIFKKTLPRIYQICVELDHRCRADLERTFPGDEGKINYMAVLGDGQVRMANICCYVCHSINGVSQLHSEIIKDSVFHDYFLYSPEKFTNVTNGIAYRRWLLAANPGLTGLLEDTIGPGFKKDASELKKLEKFKADKKVLSALEDVKDANKVIFAQHLKKVTGQEIDPHTLFDVQVKRMHEYKRQHLNALNIAAQYLYIKNNPNADVVPKTYIFGAKAAPGYYMAKQMIRLICKLGALIDADPMVREKLRVVYLEDYNVTTSERLMPASEVSEQISLAGTEASGTGNMKFMLNGAVTLGTLDGANVEIAEAAGRENEIIFGMLTPEVNDLKRFGYHPSGFINNCPEAAEVLAFLERGWGGESFHEIVNNLRTSDPYMVMADFADYRRAQNDLSGLYRDRGVWNRMSLMNIANAGIFSADRAVNDYARDIWHVKPIK